MPLRMVSSRAEQLRFIRRLIDEQGLSPNGIATASGIQSTTLYRFLEDGGTETLRTHTFNKIRTAFGEEPVTKPGFSESEATLIAPPELDMSPDSAAQAGVAFFRVNNRALEALRIEPGDILKVDLNVMPQAKDIACAQVYDDVSGSAQTIFRVYRPPILMPASSDIENFAPRIVDHDRVVLRGKVIQRISVTDFS